MTETTSAGRGEAVHALPRLRASQHFAISAFWFATNLHWMAWLMIILPKQMRDIAPRDPAWTQGVLLGFGAIPAVLVPLVVGTLSDRCRSRWGRRRPYILAGVVINVAGLALLWYAATRHALWLYVLAYFIVNGGNNISTGAYTGVIPDMVPEDQRGLASGWMAAMTQAGNIAGALGALFLPWGNQAAAAYLFIAITLVLFAAITLVGLRERTDLPPAPPVDWIGFFRSLWIDPRKHPDFAWVWITRALFVMGIISVQQYLQYYLADVMRVPRAETDKLAALGLLIGMVAATVTGLIGGAISDRIGRKVVVYVANGAIAVTVLLFLVAPSIGVVYVIAAVFGLGYGAYYSVDWALGVDVLPDKANPAKDMAVWHIAFVLPQSVALPLAGFLLSEVGHTAHPGTYSYAGYVAIFGMAATFLVLGAVLLRNVRGVR